MRRLNALLFLLLASTWLAGCASSALDMAPDRPDRPWMPATSHDGEIIAGEQGTTASSSGYILPSNPALATVSQPPPIDNAKIYTLPELIDLAESSNATTRIAWNDARKVALAAGIAESAFLPRLSATVVGASDSSTSHASAAGLGAGANNQASGTISAVSAQWLLFDFGERAAVVDAAKQASVISNIAFTSAHQQIIYDVTIAFYGHVAARSRAATASQSLKNAQAVQTAAEDRQAHGIGTAMEVAQARQATAQARLAVVQTTGSIQNAYLGLVSAIGISPLTKIRIADLSGRKLSPAMALPVENIISTSLARRPDVLGAYAAQKASLGNERAAVAEFMPKVFVSATGSYNANNLSSTLLPSVGPQAPTISVNGNRLGGAVFAGVTVPLYDGGTRDAALQQAHADVDNADLRLKKVREEAVRQIAVADNALRTSLSTYDAAQALASAGQTTFDAALAAYRSGVGSITDLTIAESQLLQARDACSDSYSTALSAAATLALSTGALGGAPQ